MSKIRLLISTKNATLQNDIFNMLSEEYLIMTTSLRIEDMNNHIDYFNPDLFLIDLTGNDSIKYSAIKDLSQKMADQKVAVVLVGDFEECEEFNAATSDLPEIVVLNPTNSIILKDKFDEYFEKHKRKAATLVKATTPPVSDKDGGVSSGSKKHILVVDDDPMMLKILKEQLREHYEVATAVNGKIALKFLETKVTDLILLDYEMPDMNGSEVLTKIRENEATKDFPVVFLTGVTEKDKISKVLVQKPQGYLLKPIDKELLYNKIKELIG